MKKKDKYLIRLLISAPLILLIIGSIYFFDLFDYVKKIYHLKNSLVIKNEDIPLFKDTIGYIVNIYTIIITGIFSYYIYKSGEKSIELAKEIKEKEDRKDKQDEVEKVFKVFYTLVYNIEKIIKNEEEKSEDIGNEILLEDNFVKDLSILNRILSKEEILKVYNLYKDFIIIKNNKKSSDNYKKSYNSIVSEVLLKEILDMNIINQVKLEYMLNEQYYDIFSRIYEKTFLQESCIKYADRILNDSEKTIHKGFYKSGEFLYEIVYLNKKKIKEKILYLNDGVYREGKYVNSKFEGFGQEFINNNLVYIGEFKDGLYNGNGEKREDKSIYIGLFIDNCFIEGYGKVYKGNKIVYEGNYKNGVYNGKGKKIDSSETYKGEFIDGQIISGEYRSSVLTFKGEFRNGRPYKGLGKRLVKDDYNNVDYQGDLAWDKKMEDNDGEEEESLYDEDYNDFLELEHYKNNPNYILVEREYANVKFENGKENIDLKNLEKKDEYVEKH